MSSVHAIMVVIIRIWAAESIISALLVIPGYVTTILTITVVDDGYMYFQTAAVQQIGWLLIGLLGWFAAPWFVKRVAIDEGAKVPDYDVTTLVAAGSFLIGMFYLVRFLPPMLFEWVFWFFERAGEGPNAASLDEIEIKGDLPFWVKYRDQYTQVMVVIAAAFMALRPSYLARAFNWLRSATLQKTAIEEE